MTTATAIVGRLTPRQKLVLIAEVVSHYARARRLLSRRELPGVLASIRNAPREAPSGDLADLDDVRLARAAILIMRLLPGDTRCLTRSLVLLGLLASRDRPARLVIGVRTGETFEAHSWLEVGGRPLLPTEGYSPLTEL
jgi:transglutaminase superfamily protein